MIKRHPFLPSLLLGALIALSACKKPAFDHRKKYTGKWKFEVEAGATEYTHTGRIDRFSHEQLRIKYGRDGQDIRLKVNRDGSLQAGGRECGQIGMRWVSFSFTWQGSPGNPGGGGTLRVKGKRTL